MAEPKTDQEFPQPLAECRLVGRLASAVGIACDRGQHISRFLVAVADDRFAVVARGELAHAAQGLRHGDGVEVRGRLVINSWSVSAGQDRAESVVEAQSIEIRCKSRSRRR
jgi:hypothetical protein